MFRPQKTKLIKYLKTALKSLLIIIFLIAALAGIVTVLYWKTNLVADAVEQYLNHELKDKGKLSYHSIKGALLNAIQLNQVEFELTSQARVRCNFIELRYDLLPLLKNRIHVSRVIIDHLEVILPGHKDTTTAKEEMPEKPLNLDSTLAAIQRANYIDSVLAVLPVMNIRNVEILMSRLSIDSAPLTLDNINLKLSRALIEKNRYQIALDKLQCRWAEKDLTLNKLAFVLDGDRRRLSLNQCQIETDLSHIEMSAYYNLGDTINANLNIYDFYVDLSDIYKIFPLSELKDGYLSGNLSLSGAPLNFSGQLKLAGRWRDQAVDSLSSNVAYNHGAYSLEHLLVKSQGGEARLNGKGYLLKGAKGLLTFKSINLAAFSPRLAQTRLNGSLQFDVEDFNLKRPTGSGRLLIYDSEADSVRADTLLFALKSERGNYEVIEPSFLQFNPESRFELEGTVSNKKMVDLTFYTFNNNIGRLLSQFGVDSVDARLDGQFRTTGLLDNPNVSGHFSMPHFGYQNISMDTIKLVLFTEKIFSQRKGQASFDIAKGRIGQIPIADVSLEATIDSNRVEAYDMHLFSGKDFIKAALNAEFSDQQTKVALPYFRVEYQNYWLQNNGDIIITDDSAAVRLEQFSLTGPENAAIEIAGFWDKSINDLQASLSLENVQVEPFETFWSKRFKLKGSINGVAELITPLHSPNLEVDLLADHLVFNSIPLGDLTCRFDYGNNLISIRELFWNLVQGEISANGNFAFRLENKMKEFSLLEETLADLKINWRGVALEQFAPFIKGPVKPKGIINGFLEVSGAVDHPILRQHLESDSLRFGHFVIDSLRMFAQYNSGYLLLDSVSATVNNTKLDLKGWQQYELRLSDIDTDFLDKPINFYLHSKGRELSFIGLLNDQLESITGDYEFTINIGGSLGQPAITDGNIRLDNGDILLSRIRDPIRNVTLRATVEDSILHLQEFSGYSVEDKDLFEKTWRFLVALLPWSDRSIRDGRATAQGQIDLSQLIRPRLDLQAQLDEFYIDYFLENTRLLLTSDMINIAGRDTLRVTGEIYIPKGTYEVDLTQMEKNLYLAPAVTKATPPYLFVDLDIQIPGNFVITSSPLDLTNNFKVTMMGDLHVIMEPEVESAQISGNLEGVSGKYSSWNQNFDVNSLSVDFRNPKTLNPEIDMVAAKRVGNRIFEIIISGNLENMNQEIRVTEGGRELDLSMPDKIAMLTLGADIGQVTAHADSALRNVGENVATTSLLTAIERSAEKYTGLDKVEIGRGKSVVDLEKFKLNNGLSDASISFGKYLTSDLYVEYRTQLGSDLPAPRLSWQTGNRLGLEYRINRSWTLDSYYEKTIRGNNKIQIGIRWEYTF